MYHLLLHPLSQEGWTAVLLSARYGHKDLVQELCDTFGADFLHRKKVRAMQILSGSEWLSELCMCDCTADDVTSLSFHKLLHSSSWFTCAHITL